MANVKGAVEVGKGAAKRVPAAVRSLANGDVLLEVNGPAGEVAESYTLRMKTNALCRLEQLMGDHVHKLGRRLTNPGMQDLRAILCAALSDHHPDVATLAGAGDLIDRAGFEVCAPAALEAFAAGFPSA